MNQQLERQLLLTRLRSFITILHDRGLTLNLPEDEALEKMSNNDLAEAVRQLRDLARTPVQG
jgi:hypothetical protein